MREDEADSLVRLGKDYLHIRNYDKAMEYLGHAVMLGKTNAVQDLYALGEHFLAEKNYKKAEEAFQMLADRGHGESCLILGEMCGSYHHARWPVHRQVGRCQHDQGRDHCKDGRP